MELSYHKLGIDGELSPVMHLEGRNGTLSMSGFCKIFTLISSFMRDGVEHPTSYVEASRKGDAQRAEQ